jgi:transposase
MDAVALEQLPEPARCFVDRLQQTIGSLQQNLSSLQQENRLLRQKIDALIKKYFGGQKSEAIDPKQLELLLAGLAQAILSTPAPPAPASTNCRPATERKKAVRQPLPAHLPVERVVLEPAEVKDQPQAWKQIGQEITEELDWQPAQFIKRLYIRPKYVRREEPATPSAQLVDEAIQTLYVASEAAVVIAPLPSRLIEKGLPGAGLLAQVIISKYEDHLPLYRQEKIYRQRHGVKLARATLAEWVEHTAQWLQPVYEAMKRSLLRGNYLQVDETPIRYLDPDVPGKSQLGYLWTYSRPGAEVLFDWQTSRGQEGPATMLKTFAGLLQSDGYNVYESLARERPDWTLLGCWAHARRKFVDALGEDRRAGWVVRQLGQLYGLEKRLREVRAGPRLRQAMRASEAAPVLRRLHTMLTKWQERVLPQSLMGKAIAYPLERWEALNRYVEHGRAEIDNNLVENAIRPTAVGKKNFLFIGHPEAGWRSAVIYSVLGSCRRLGVDPHEYLRDVLRRLPEMKMSQVESITPAAWAKARKAATRKRN